MYFRIKIGVVSVMLACGVAIFAAPMEAAEEAHYSLTQKVKLGGPGSWDYFEVDSTSHRIYIPRTSHLMVLDSSGSEIGDIPNLAGAHAVALATELNLGFIANDTSRSVTTFDLKTLKILRETPVGTHGPDGILYDSFSGRVFTFNGDVGRDATALDAKTGKVIGVLPLKGKPETAQSDERGHIYVVIQNSSELVVFDANTLEIQHRYPLAPCVEPAGLSIDPVHNRLFAGCRNQVMTLIDTVSGKVLSSVPIGWLVDATRFDPKTGFAFASTFDAQITVAKENPSGALQIVQTIKTQMGARTMALDTANHNLYVVTADFPVSAATPANPHPRPAPLPNTFTLLIFTQ